MECGQKRKLDCIADMEVLIHPGVDLLDFEEQKKRVRLSVQLSTGSTDVRMADNRSSTSADWGWLRHDHSAHNHHHHGMDTEIDDKSDDQDDIPSTSEVINSLRKVILWMGAQGDHNEDYIQYLSQVERYAKSKQCDMAQQRKITQYLIRRDQPIIDDLRSAH